MNCSQKKIARSSNKEITMAEKKKDKAPSTGLKKFLGQEAKMYEPIKKGSGKPKYQNVIKEARVDTKKPTVTRVAGKALTKAEAKAKMKKAPNLPKQIDREEKVRKGVRTEKPSTKKVPVKPRGGAGMRGGLGSFGSGGGMRGSVNK
jgi:hypothetical protein